MRLLGLQTDTSVHVGIIRYLLHIFRLKSLHETDVLLVSCRCIMRVWYVGAQRKEMQPSQRGRFISSQVL